ncbi:MAG TPA: hypothetical protein V6C58_15990 [Allocoleopsis sp.]
MNTKTLKQTLSIVLTSITIVGLNSIIEVIKLSQQTLIKIRQNLFWAFAYNIIGIPIAAGLLLPTFGILLNPATAGALMAFSSISVVTNSINNK